MSFTSHDAQTLTQNAFGGGKKPRARRQPGQDGKRLERLLCGYQAGVVLTNVPQAARRIGGGKVLAVRGPCDVFGAYTGTGRAIVLDAKESKLEHRLQTSDDHLPEHQRLALIRHGEAGAVSGLLCLRRCDDRLLWCGWRMLLTRRPSIPWTEMVDVGPAGRGIDWTKIANA